MNWILPTVIASVIALAAVFVMRPDTIQVPDIDNPVGAAAGPERDGPCESVNGATQCFTRKPFAAATTTVCAIKSPNATSSLTVAGVNMTTSSTTASLLVLAKATTAFATTTQIGSSINIAANAKDAFFASTTAAQAAAEVTVFAPNTYLVLGMQGGIGDFSPLGTCTATFEVL